MPLPEKVKPYSISAISKLIKSKLEGEFPSVWIEGEVSKFMRHSSGHIYITLKDDKAVLDANLWKQKSSVLKFEPEVGMKVLVRGRISSYAPYSKYNLVIEEIEPAGLGALQMRFEQLKKKLSAKRYFDESVKKPIPVFPKVIGVVTSATGAAFKDIARILKRRDPGIKIILAPTNVEGESAKDSIAEAIDDFNAYGNVDLLIVGRGGGSPESLWAFNEEVVADAIHRSKIPIISAVGHEIDFTIADMVADLRASTPSAAAEQSVKERADVIYTVESFGKRMSLALSNLLEIYKSRFVSTVESSVFRYPTRYLEEYRQRVDENFTELVNVLKRNMDNERGSLASLYRHLQILRPENLVRRQKENVANLKSRLAKSISSIVATKERQYAVAGGKLNSLSPLKVLERGYSITVRPNGEVLKDAGQVKEGDSLELRLHKGKLDVEVRKRDI